MVKQIFSIYDSKSCIYLPPFLAHNEQDAQRQCLVMLKKDQTIMSMCPEDYGLFELGTYCDSSGKIISSENVKKVVDFKSLMPED